MRQYSSSHPNADKEQVLLNYYGMTHFLMYSNFLNFIIAVASYMGILIEGQIPSVILKQRIINLPTSRD
jgi:hypothetical protein